MDETTSLLIKTQAEQISLLTEVNLIQSKQNEQLLGEQKNMQEKMDKLLAQVAWLTRMLFGRKSEKLASLDPNQLSLFEMTAEEKTLLAQIESDRDEAVKEIEITPVQKKTERKNRKLLEGLPVTRIEIEPENIDKTKYKKIGEEITRTLEFEPGKLSVKEIVRVKFGLIDNITPAELGQPAVIIAPLPLLPIHKGLPGASLLAEILLNKYEYHLPFYRQVQAFHHLGLKIPENTLNGWFKPICELLKPMYEVLKTVVLETDYVQVDETTLPVINKDSHQASKEYLWVVRSVMQKLVFFHYNDGSRSQKTAEKLLYSFKGYLQSDGCPSYNIFDVREEVCHIACLAHIRRKYTESRKENAVLADYALGEIQKLYRIEHMADEQNLSFQERQELRQKLAKPIMLSFEKWMEKRK